MSLETRNHKGGCEVRQGPNGPIITGYAAVFNSDSEDMGFIEQVDPAAFNRTVNLADVRALGNHEADWLLGRTKSGTLRLAVDGTGLRYEIDVNSADPDGQRALAKVQRGDWDGSSFSFQTIRDEWNWQANPPQRRLLEVALIDVGPVTFPAYADTTAAARALERVAANTGHPVEELVTALHTGEIRSLVAGETVEPAAEPGYRIIAGPVTSREQLAAAETRDGDPANMVAMAGAVAAAYYARLAAQGIEPSDGGVSMCSLADQDGDADGDGQTLWAVYDETGVWYLVADGTSASVVGYNDWQAMYRGYAPEAEQRVGKKLSADTVAAIQRAMDELQALMESMRPDDYEPEDGPRSMPVALAAAAVLQRARDIERLRAAA